MTAKKENLIKKSNQLTLVETINNTKEEKKEVKKEEIKKETSNNNLNDILNSLDKTLFISCAGQRKENIYKKEIFANCISDRDKKSARRKIRNVLESYISSFIKMKDNKEYLIKLKVEFDKFYSNVYSLNDYSLNSFISNNTDNVKKENLQTMLDIIKSIS